jgi:hypothetical protein
LPLPQRERGADILAAEDEPIALYFINADDDEPTTN